ncbi:restriction endonuclease subunit S [Helicobacter pylori]|nr:restriction endonuclease subunit S [Helicobacter pylori]
MDALTTPSNWQRVRLGDILELLTDYHANGSYEILKNNVTLLKNVDFAIMIRTTNFENNDFKNDLIYIDKKAYEFLSKSKVFAGDILVNKIANAGTAYFMPKLNQPVSLGMNLFLLRIKPSYNNLFIFKQIANYERVLKTFANGSATKTITKNVIKNLLIPLPPLNEQIAIANILSDMDRYLYSLDALILKKESVKKALRIKMLNQILASNGVEFKKIGEICLIKRGRVIAKKILQENGKYPVYSSQTLNNGILGFIDTYDFDGEFLTWTTDGAYAGSVFYRNGRFSITNVCGLLQVIQDNILHKYLYYILQITAPLHVNPGMGNPKLMSVAMQQIQIPIPPLNEQIAIANILSALDNEIISLKNKKRQFENIKKALNHDLMSAKIRVLNK